jgi:hypothetical protein
MQPDILTSRIEFARSAEKRRDEIRFQRDVERRRDLKEERTKTQDVENDLNDLALGVVLATDTQIAEFAVTLDTYDEATVKALMKNEELLDEAREKVEALLGKAYVLPDGRRVFKTNDGLQVFDEFGVELDSTVIDPNEISDTLPRWEIVVEARGGVEKLETERTEILDFQQRVDDARERLDDDGLTTDDLDDMKNALEAEMPLAVRQQMANFVPSSNVTIKADFAGAASLPLVPAERAPVAGLDF